MERRKVGMRRRGGGSKRTQEDQNLERNSLGAG